MVSLVDVGLYVSRRLDFLKSPFFILFTTRISLSKSKMEEHRDFLISMKQLNTESTRVVGLGLSFYAIIRT